MTAYCVGQIGVKDAVAWEAYRSQVGATISRHGGELMFRGAVNQVLSGTIEYERVVAIRFESIDAAKQWHDSPEYQALIPLREKAADMTLVLFQD